MSDESSPETPPEGQEPGAVEPQEEPTLPPGTTEPAGEPAAPQQEPEVSLEEKILHKMQSWVGRRDQQLMESLKGMVQQPAAAVAKAAPDPAENANEWFDYMYQQRVSQVQRYNDTLYKTGTTMIDSDPVVQADAGIKDEIVQEIQSGRVQINRNLDPETAAAVAVSMAKANVLTRRMTQPKNPLAGNKPTGTPKGGIAPPAAAPAPKVKLGKVSGLARSAAKRWGYSDEEMAKVLGAE